MPREHPVVTLNPTTDLAYPCDICGEEYDTEDEALTCEEEHAAEEENEDDV